MFGSRAPPACRPSRAEKSGNGATNRTCCSGTTANTGKSRLTRTSTSAYSGSSSSSSSSRRLPPLGTTLFLKWTIMGKGCGVGGGSSVLRKLIREATTRGMCVLESIGIIALGVFGQ